MALSSCEYKSDSVKALENQRDSLLIELSQRDSVANAMNDYLETISSSLDSIKNAENIYSITVGEDGQRLRKDVIKNNLNLLEQVIQRQRVRIEDLESRIKASRDSSSHYKIIIANLYRQLDEKDAQIRKIQEEMDRKEKIIVRLNQEMNSVKETLASAEEKNREQSEVIEMQTGILNIQDKLANTGFIVAASKKELQQMGVLGTGFNSAKIDYSNIDTSKYPQVDMREFSEMSFEGKRIKLLSSMPADSYTIVKSKEGSILSVTDQGKFWSITPILIIQILP